MPFPLATQTSRPNYLFLHMHLRLTYERTHVRKANDGPFFFALLLRPNSSQGISAVPLTNNPLLKAPKPSTPYTNAKNYYNYSISNFFFGEINETLALVSFADRNLSSPLAPLITNRFYK